MKHKAEETIEIAKSTENVNTDVIFECPDCDDMFTGEQSLKHHKETKHVKISYKCQNCEKKFSSQERLRTHVDKHNKDVHFSCTKCPKKFGDNDELKTHRKVHYQDKSFTCPTCDVKFPRSEFKNHMLTHSKDHTFMCNICKQMSKNSEELKRHINSTHANNSKKQNLHEKRTQRAMKRLCISCNLFFESDNVLSNHIDKNHVKDIRKVCPKCSIRPNNSYELNRHLITDHDEGWRIPRQGNHRNYDYQRPTTNQRMRHDNYYPRGKWYDTEYPPISTSNRFSVLTNQKNVRRGQM